MDMDDPDLNLGWRNFAKVMGLAHNPNLGTLRGWWFDIFEFSMFMGPALLDPQINGDDLEFKEKHVADLRHKTASMTGPHSETILKAYKIRRYSLMGRVKAPIIKLCHAVIVLRTILRAVRHKFWKD